ncbi:hypothetical protein CROQUDRAFT_659689 [Cronartium quercuum f. sp. fusiforme G11]|uniref:ABC transporter domain-containing protein n=1 Tax=Cronartium quercuum f. sp. fusiforme G11 TaxID=708437 RepID=A0A9P6NI66_9BASI|nr:hypothetical protein CROQUDRAFT_659689 [Cronartium quercuum f. sp. fusiforme G11]
MSTSGMARFRLGLLLLLTLSRLTFSNLNNRVSSSISLVNDPFSRFANHRPDGCPPCPECFNCQLPRFVCKQFGTCDEYDGQCRCPEGFGGQDCGQPLCGSLADGEKRHARPDNATSCECKPGWSGINCNVCETDQACSALVPPVDRHTGRPMYAGSLADEGNETESSDAVCYKGGFAVRKNHQMCNVTNRKILDMLPDRPPQVSFTCDMNTAACQFQFWIGGIESFYCAFDQCRQSIQVGYEGGINVTTNECSQMQCKCVPGRMLCGESGSVDIGDFLHEEIKGPGKFSCSSDGQGCKFEEPAMNQLITDVFGDTYITLDCQSGECMHYTLVPGFKAPARPDNSQLVALSIAVTLLFVILASSLFWHCGRNRAHKYPAYLHGQIRLPAEESNHFKSNADPTDLTFSKISYSVAGNKPVLREVFGQAKSGQMMAIMGASGAGKSSLLDILAKKPKAGSVEGEILVNGQRISNEAFKRLIGYVDQEDTLLSTLTVYETVLCSAMLRLPRTMSVEAKKLRTLETLDELGILAIKNSFIGKSGHRSISGGEKRRVSIACELVTSPRMLFLDEPTSGLDSFNAFNVIDALAKLARNHQRTIIFTIHQPQSNIIALFDQLVLLGRGGRLVYSGAFSQCHDYFKQIGHPCPIGYNLADFLIDLTMKQHTDAPQSSAEPCGSSAHSPPLKPLDLSRTNIAATTRSPGESPGETELTTRKMYHEPTGSLRARQSASRLRQPSSSILKRFSLLYQLTTDVEAKEGEEDIKLLVELETAFADSDLVKQFGRDYDRLLAGARAGADLNTAEGVSRATGWEQFRILSGRAFKNLYRNPMLMLSHYLLAIVLAVICAALFHDVTMDIGGFQGRMGLFFFILALFGFSSLTTISLFAQERLIFMRERANGYYHPIAYFASKAFFDLLPLRIVPPFILGSLVYYPVGLVASLEQFWKFLLVLIGFNLTSASVVLLISLVLADGGVANLVGSLVMLFNLLFAGLLVNREKLPIGTAWIQEISFFHAAFEALLVNEVRYLTLKDHRYGVDIEVPSASILSLFGFRITAFWWPDMTVLTGIFLGAMSFSGLVMVVFVKERR